MSATDHPLKQLVTAFIFDFARWLLQMDIQEVTSRNIELHPPSDPIFSDQIFLVKLADGRTVILHIEFQGKQTHRPMRFRLLDYLSRIVLTYPDAMVMSVVLYVGHGAGEKDSGEYRILQPDGTPCVEWRYKVVRLWDMDAETLLAMDSPSLLPLVGQMRIHQPAVVFPHVVERLHAVEDEEQRWRLLSAFVALIDDEEKLQMIENLMENNELLLDTPFLRRIREQTLQKAQEEFQLERERLIEDGFKLGLKQGLGEKAKVLEQGIERGELRTRRNDIVELLQVRFNLPETEREQLAAQLETVQDEATLRTLFHQAALAADMAAFRAVLND